MRIRSIGDLLESARSGGAPHDVLVAPESLEAIGKRIAELEAGIEDADTGQAILVEINERQQKRAERAEARMQEMGELNARLRNELTENLYAQMLRCSEDAAHGYEVPGGGDELDPECGTTCKCPLDCAVYQRWLDLANTEPVHADKGSAGGEG